MKLANLAARRGDDRDRRADALRRRFSKVSRSIERRAALLRAGDFAFKLMVATLAFLVSGVLGLWMIF